MDIVEKALLVIEDTPVKWTHKCFYLWLERTGKTNHTYMLLMMRNKYFLTIIRVSEACDNIIEGLARQLDNE